MAMSMLVFICSVGFAPARSLDCDHLVRRVMKRGTLLTRAETSDAKSACGRKDSRLVSYLKCSVS